MHIPAPLLRNGASIVVKVFILRLEKTVHDAISFRLWSHVRAEQDAVSVVQEEAPRQYKVGALAHPCVPRYPHNNSDNGQA